MAKNIAGSNVCTLRAFKIILIGLLIPLINTERACDLIVSEIILASSTLLSIVVAKVFTSSL